MHQERYATVKASARTLVSPSIFDKRHTLARKISSRYTGNPQRWPHHFAETWTNKTIYGFCWCTAGRLIANGFKMCRLWLSEEEREQRTKKKKVDVRDSDLWPPSKNSAKHSAPWMGMLQWVSRFWHHCFLWESEAKLKLGLCRLELLWAKQQLTYRNLWCWIHEASGVVSCGGKRGDYRPPRGRSKDLKCI